MTTTPGAFPMRPYATGGESAPRPSGPYGGHQQTADVPIFTALARRWERSGRSVPGEDDREWAELVHRSPWPGGW